MSKFQNMSKPMQNIANDGTTDKRPQLVPQEEAVPTRAAAAKNKGEWEAVRDIEKGAVPTGVKKKSFIGRIFSFPKRIKEKGAGAMDSRQSVGVGVVCEREGRESDGGEVEREKVGEGRISMDDHESEGYQEKKVEDVHVPHGDIAELLQDTGDEADAEPRNLSEGEERRGPGPLTGASEGREDHEKRKSHKETQSEQECSASNITDESVMLEEKQSEGREEVVVGKDVREDVLSEILAEIKKLNTRMKAIEQARN
jgi:hypothetical protein